MTSTGATPWVVALVRPLRGKSMKRFLGAALVVILTVSGSARADEQAAKAVLDKGIKALGGEERLSKVKAFTLNGKGTIVLEGNDIPFSFQITAKGIEQYRSNYEGEAGGEKFSGATVVDGGKGWRKIGDEIQKLEGESLENEKRNAYLDVAPILLTLLKGKGFKLDLAAEEKATTGIRATGPDGKDFTVRFDKESGLPISLSGKVVDAEGQEFTQRTTFEEYREFDGIKVATKSSIKKDGEHYIEVEGMELKVLDKIDPDTFAEPK
jgi:hypothetical protein